MVAALLSLSPAEAAELAKAFPKPPSIFLVAKHETATGIYRQVNSTVGRLPGLDEHGRQLLARRLAATAVRRDLLSYFVIRACAAFMGTLVLVTATLDIMPATDLPREVDDAIRLAMLFASLGLIGAAGVVQMAQPRIREIVRPALSLVPAQVFVTALAVL
jgi:hypothetical protein